MGVTRYTTRTLHAFASLLLISIYPYMSYMHMCMHMYLSVHCYQVYFRIGAEGRRPEAPLRVGGLRDNFAGLASVTAAGA